MNPALRPSAPPTSFHRLSIRVRSASANKFLGRLSFHLEGSMRQLIAPLSDKVSRWWEPINHALAMGSSLGLPRDERFCGPLFAFDGAIILRQSCRLGGRYVSAADRPFREISFSLFLFGYNWRHCAGSFCVFLSL